MLRRSITVASLDSFMDKTRNRYLILFEGPHIAYSPTISQLYRELEAFYDVTIFTSTPSGITEQKPPEHNVVYYDFDHNRFKKYYHRAAYTLLLFFQDKETRQFNKQFPGKYKEYFFRYRRLKKLVEENKYQRILSVDIKNLFYCTLLGIESDFLSLELCTNNGLLPLIDKNKIGCVLIQTPDRYNYLFQGEKLRTFYIQNAPVYRPMVIPVDRKGIIYAGTAWAAFGFYHCLDFIDKFKNEQLFVQGLVPPADRKKIESEYGGLLREKRLTLTETYLDNDEMVDFIAHFEIGFCFYDFSVDWIDNFNYRTAPSGKLFKYLAAGVPVVCNDIPGFQFVRDYQCGVLITDLDPESISRAVLQIRDQYKLYTDNAFKTAERFSFDKAVKPYLDYIKGN